MARQVLDAMADHGVAGDTLRVADYDVKLPGWRIVGGRYRVALARDAADRTVMLDATLDGATMKP